MGWQDTTLLVLVAFAALGAGIWASKRIGDALDWLSGDMADAGPLTQTDASAMSRELTSR